MVEAKDSLLSGSNYRLKTAQFEGPLDLLLDLIEKRKLHIGDFSLAQVADDYIAYIRAMEKFPLGDVAHFLVIAATLVLLKSKALLPQLKLSEDEEGSIDDLKRRLMMLEKFRELSIGVKSLFLKNRMFFRSERNDSIVFAPHPSISIQNLLASVESVKHALPKHENIPKAVVKKVVSIEEMMNRLSVRIQQALKTSFKEFSGHHGKAMTREEKVHIVVSFLAMLELVKQGVLDVVQEHGFGDIHMESLDLTTPQYTEAAS
jgi:segregation and condensation protein A